MTHRKTLEQVLDLLINEEHESASELLHSVIVEKARTLYEDLVDEDFGGDEKEDFANEIEADKEEIESDEMYDDDSEEEGEVEMDYEGDEPAEEEEIEDRIEDVESQLAELQVQFDAIINGEDAEVDVDVDVEGDLEVDDVEGFGDVELGGEEEEMEYADEDMYEKKHGKKYGKKDYDDEGMYEEIIDDLDEATKLQDTVADTGQKQEGKFAGTGKQSKIGATGKESPYTRAPRKAEHGGKPHKTGVGGDESTKKVGEGEDNTPTSNIDVKTGEKKSADVSAKDDKGAVSPLGSKGSPKGV